MVWYISGSRASAPLRKGKISGEVRNLGLLRRRTNPSCNKQACEATQSADKKTRYALIQQAKYDDWCHDLRGAMFNHQSPPPNTVQQKKKTAGTNPFSTGTAVATYTLLHVHPPRTRSCFFKLQASCCRDEGDGMNWASGSRTPGLQASHLWYSNTTRWFF